MRKFTGIALIALVLLLAAQAAWAEDTFTLLVGGKAASGTYEVERGQHLAIEVSGEGLWKDVTVATVAWRSSDASVAFVELGVVYAQKVGTTQITATAVNGSQSTSRSLTVKVLKSSTNPTTVSLHSTGGVTSIPVGETLQLVADVSPAGTELAWKSSAPAVASVDSDGLVTARKAGKASITVTAQDGSDVSDSLTLTVQASANTISLNRKTATLYVGGVTSAYRTSTQLVATVKPSTAAGTVSWSSSDGAVASVGAKGKVTAHKAGKAVITATAGGKKASCTVTVQKLPTKVQLPQSKQLRVGKRLNLAALMKIDGTLTRVKWKSFNKKIARVSAAGVVLGVRPGKVKIAVKTVNGKTDVCVVRVTR